MHAEVTLQLGSGAICSAPSSLWQKSTCIVRLSMHYYLTFTWNEKLHSSWKDIKKSSRPSEKKRTKHVVGIFGDYFLVIVQLHHLIGLDPGHHLLGQQKHSSNPIKTTALQVGASEYSLPVKTRMCLSISLFTSTSWGTLRNPAGRKRDEEHILHEITKH